MKKTHSAATTATAFTPKSKITGIRTRVKRNHFGQGVTGEIRSMNRSTTASMGPARLCACW